MDTALLVIDREPQLWSWTAGPYLGYALKNETASLAEGFSVLARAMPNGAQLLSAEPDRAVDLLKKQRAGVVVLSDHTVRENRLENLNGVWRRANAKIGFTGMTLYAWNKSNQAVAIQSALLDLFAPR